MRLMRLIYASQPVAFDEPTLAGILEASQRNNARTDITGTLICRDDLFLQLLEGDRADVESVYSSIRKDVRHRDVTTLVQEIAAQRLFPTWAMRHDAVKSWMWSREQVAAGRVRDATRDEVLAVFVRLVAEPPGHLSGVPRAVPVMRPRF